MNNIKLLRENAKLSQAELATKLGVTQQAIAKWETGGAMPRADKILALASALNCTAEELLIYEDEST